MKLIKSLLIVLTVCFLISGASCSPETTSKCGNGICENDENESLCRVDCGSGICGNGIKETAEECDKGDLGMSSCVTIGYDGGSLGCTDDCRFETSNCTGCHSNCTTPGELQCSGNDIEICGYENECLMWLLGQACGADNVCSDFGGTPHCESSSNNNNCQNICTIEGAQRCNGDFIQTCGDSGDGCLSWNDISDCSAQSLTCEESSETAACVSRCDTANAIPSGGYGGQTGETTQTLNGRSCLVYVPTNISSTNCLPYMQVYHGYGADPSQPYNHWISAAQSRNFILVSVPFTGPGTGDGAHANGVREEMATLYNINMNRCYLGGFSAGAQQALEIAGTYDGWAGANLVSTGAAHTSDPGCGSPPVSLYWLFGDADTTFGGIDYVRQSVATYQSWGFNVHFIEVPGGTHSIYINNPNEAWDWLFMQP